MIRTDVLRNKGVHVKLDKDTHAEFKIRLLRSDLTMQEAFEEFAKQVAVGFPSAIRIIERLAMNKVKAELATVGLKRSGTRKRLRPMEATDHETLYELINEVEDSGGGSK